MIRRAWVLLLAGCASGVSLRSDFEGAAIGRIERVSDTHFRCAVEGQADQDGRNRQKTWYAFRLDGAGSREVTVTLTDLEGEYDYRPGAVGITGDTAPVWSYDGRTWTHFPSASYDAAKKELTLRFTPRGGRVWIAHVEPYTASRHERFMAEIRSHPDLLIETVGKTVEGRDLHLLTITDRGSDAAARQVVWTMFRQHAWESGSSFAGEGAIRFMLSEEARGLRARVIFKAFPMMDPDGCARGGVRFNRYGYDLNRNWDTVALENAEHRRLMPEISAAKRALHEWQDAGRRIDLFLTLHNTETGEYLTASEVAPALGDRLFRTLREMTTFHPGQDAPRPSRDRPAPDRWTVYDYLESSRRVPAFLMEQRISFNAKLGRLPTSGDRLEFGRRLAGVLCRTALGE